MRKAVKKGMTGFCFSEDWRFDTSVENSKRRRMLGSLAALDAGSRMFFERVLITKKMRELIFITKAEARNR